MAQTLTTEDIEAISAAVLALLGNTEEAVDTWIHAVEVKVDSLLAAVGVLNTIQRPKAMLALRGQEAGLRRMDAGLMGQAALPNGNVTTYTNAVDIGTPSGRGSAPMELLVTVPALPTEVLADDATMAYTLQHSDTADFASPATIDVGVLLQTGAEGAGAAALQTRLTLPPTTKRYVRLSAANDSTGDASPYQMAFGVVF